MAAGTVCTSGKAIRPGEGRFPKPLQSVKIADRIRNRTQLMHITILLIYCSICSRMMLASVLLFFVPGAFSEHKQDVGQRADRRRYGENNQ
jgi:hypothetical protein